MYIHVCIWFLHFLTFEICFWYTDKRASQNTKRWLGNLTFEKTWLWILIVTTFDWSFCQCNKIVVPKWLWLEMSTFQRRAYVQKFVQTECYVRSVLKMLLFLDTGCLANWKKWSCIFLTLKFYRCSIRMLTSCTRHIWRRFCEGKFNYDLYSTNDKIKRKWLINKLKSGIIIFDET